MTAPPEQLHLDIAGFGIKQNQSMAKVGRSWLHVRCMYESLSRPVLDGEIPVSGLTFDYRQDAG
jgi:hypothetical protein